MLNEAYILVINARLLPGVFDSLVQTQSDYTPTLYYGGVR